MYLTFVIRILGVLGTFGFLFLLSKEYSFEIVGQFTRLTVSSAFTSMISRYSSEFLMERYKSEIIFSIPNTLLRKLLAYHLLFSFLGMYVLSTFIHEHTHLNAVNYFMLTVGLSLISYNFQIYSLCDQSEMAAAINLSTLQLFLIPFLLMKIEYSYIITIFSFLALLLPLLMLMGKVDFVREDDISWTWLSGISITVVPYILGSGILFYLMWILENNMLGQLNIVHKFFTFFLIVSQLFYSRSLRVSAGNWSMEYDKISRKPALALLVCLFISYPLLRRVFDFDEGVLTWYIISIVFGFCYAIVGPSASFAVLIKKENRLVRINWLAILLVVIISFCYPILSSLMLYTALLLLGLVYRLALKKLYL